MTSVTMWRREIKRARFPLLNREGGVFHWDQRERQKKKRKKRSIPLQSETPVDPCHNLMKPVKCSVQEVGRNLY